MTMEKDEELESAFQQLVGRQATDQERIRLYRVKEALNIKPNDSLWLIIIVLEHYTSLYEQIPSQIKKLHLEQNPQKKQKGFILMMMCTAGAMMQLIWQILCQQTLMPIDVALLTIMICFTIGLWIKTNHR